MVTQEKDEKFMGLAIAQAKLAWEAGEVPVGAVLVRGEEILSLAHNHPVAGHDPSAHAEMLAIRQAGARIGNYRLMGSTLYVTLEPCIMCAGVIIHARISRLVYGAGDPKNGGVVSLYRILEDVRLNHRVDVTPGILEKNCAEILSGFFKEKRVGSLPISG